MYRYSSERAQANRVIFSNFNDRALQSVDSVDLAEERKSLASYSYEFHFILLLHPEADRSINDACMSAVKRKLIGFIVSSFYSA